MAKSPTPPALMFHWSAVPAATGVGINKIKADISSGVLKTKRVAGKNYVTLSALQAYVESFPDGPVADAGNLKSKKSENN